MAQLNWANISETNNQGFELQKSKDTRSWTTLEFIAGRGNNNTLTHYEHLDTRPFSGYNYYRLKQLDYDNASEYLDVIIVLYRDENSNNLNVYLNPVKDRIFLKLSKNLKSAISEIRIWGGLGRLVYEGLPVSIGDEIEVNRWGRGVYFLSF